MPSSISRPNKKLSPPGVKPKLPVIAKFEIGQSATPAATLPVASHSRGFGSPSTLIRPSSQSATMTATHIPAAAMWLGMAKTTTAASVNRSQRLADRRGSSADQAPDSSRKQNIGHQLAGKPRQTCADGQHRHDTECPTKAARPGQAPAWSVRSARSSARTGKSHSARTRMERRCRETGRRGPNGLYQGCLSWWIQVTAGIGKNQGEAVPQCRSHRSEKHGRAR